MLPVSTKDVIRFTPQLDQLAMLQDLRDKAETDTLRDGFDRLIEQLRERIEAEPQPVYLLGIASHFQRAAFRRDVLAAGATYPGDATMYAALREDVTAVDPVNLEELLGVIDEVEAGQNEDVDPDVLNRMPQIARIARALGGRFAALEGDREYWLSVAPLIACRHLLLGWEGVADADGRALPFVRRLNQTADETLARLDEGELRAIGYKIMNLMRPSAEQKKGSASPSPSVSGRKPMKAERKRRTARAGSSSASTMPAIPAST